MPTTFHPRSQTIVEVLGIYAVGFLFEGAQNWEEGSLDYLECKHVRKIEKAEKSRYGKGIIGILACAEW